MADEEPLAAEPLQRQLPQPPLCPKSPPTTPPPKHKPVDKRQGPPWCLRQRMSQPLHRYVPLRINVGIRRMDHQKSRISLLE